MPPTKRLRNGIYRGERTITTGGKNLAREILNPSLIITFVINVSRVDTPLTVLVAICM